MLELPIAVEKIFDFMPHRPPMIWIDNVLEVNEKGGKCSLLVKDGTYLSGGMAGGMADGGVRPSSYVEFMAQSFGYISACQFQIYPDSGRPKPQVVYLCGIRDLELSLAQNVTRGELLTIEVQRTHEIGPLILFDGRVTKGDGSTVAKGQIKLFAQ